MSRLKRNIVANFAGHLWIAAMSLLFVPVYIHYLGVEAWGLIGFFAVLQGLLGLVDLGLSATLNRELARMAPQDESRADLVRTLEVLYWAVALLAGIAVFVAAPLIASRWLHVQHLSGESVRQAVTLMGLVITLQLPFSFYSGGLLGLQKQIHLNAINIVAGTLRSAGAAAILAFVSPTVTTYFIWQAALSGVQTIAVALELWRSLAVSGRPARFRRELLRNVWRFSAGMMGIGVTATFLTQIDKIVLSKMLTMEVFGYYVLAAALAAGLYRIITPLFASIFPRFSELAALGDSSLSNLYHTVCQLAAVMVIPVAAVIAFFSREVLFLWTRNAMTAERAHVVLTILIAGTALNGLMNIPYALQLAHGWTRLTFWNNIVACLALTPLLVAGVWRFGAVGGAAGWLALNIVFMTFSIGMMHRRLLPGERSRWYVDDFAKPVAAALCVTAIARVIFPYAAGALIQVAALVLTVVLAAAAAAFAAPLMRRFLVGAIRLARPRDPGRTPIQPGDGE